MGYAEGFAFAGCSSQIEESDFSILGMPYDGTVSFNSGAARGPRSIREASYALETFLLHWKLDMADLKIHDAGDIPVGPQPDIFNQLKYDYANLPGMCTLIGGEHSITAPVVEVLLKKHPDLQVVVLDAHLDFREEYFSNKLSHACVVRRISELVGNRVQVLGVRSAGKEEKNQANELGLSYQEVENWDTGALPSSGPVYLSLDMDVIDPSFAPSVGTPVFHGLSPKHIRDVIRQLGSQLVGFDICEVSSPGPDTTAVLAASLIQEAIAARAVADGLT